MSFSVKTQGMSSWNGCTPSSLSLSSTLSIYFFWREPALGIEIWDIVAFFNARCSVSKSYMMGSLGKYSKN